MSSEPVISIREISKAYRIAHEKHRATTLGEALMRRIKSPMARPEYENFWALREVSFEVDKGDVVGIIGRNGSGKSTLLKVLSRITEPTSGEAVLKGRVGSLLEVGTGFSAELTGRENIFLNGAILGMSRRYIEKQFDAIVDFAGVEKFLDTPVKRYSSGMYVRLAFAVAAHLNPEILIVDEVLAVGDADFQKRCIGKMKDVSQEEGRTVLFVSHNMQSISVLCNKVAVMRGGKLAFFGDTEEGIALHLESYNPHVREDEVADERPGSGQYRFVSVVPEKGLFNTADPKRFRFRAERRKEGDMPFHLQARIVNDMGVEIAACDSRLMDVFFPKSDVVEGTFCFTTPWLKPGHYHLDAYIKTTGQNIDAFHDCCFFEIGPLLPYEHAVWDIGQHGVVFSDFSWTIDA